MGKAIIAMKGFPFTSKTAYATVIGACLRCPVLSLEDVLDVLHPKYLQTCLSSNTNTTPSSQPRDLSFQIICQMTKSHLSKEISENVVIDSSLSSQSHLNQLIELASSLENTRLVIVECKPKNNYTLKLEFQRWTSEYGETQKWYKAKNLQDVEKAIQEDYDETKDGYKVSKLVLDPLLDTVIKKLFALKLLKDPKSVASGTFIEAVKYMINRIEDDDTDHIVDYDKWKHAQQFHSLDVQERKKLCCKAGHTITNYTEARLEYEANCMACGNQVMAQAYSCNNCGLVLHKDCAESFDAEQKQGTCGPFACASCKEDEKSFSGKCLSCYFEIHLRSRQRPTIIRHECHNHFLCIQARGPGSIEIVRCAACGEFWRDVMYWCKSCNVAYHSRCLRLPSRFEHVHGGHHHHMQLRFSSDEAEDYMCDVCTVKDKGIVSTWVCLWEEVEGRRRYLLTLETNSGRSFLVGGPSVYHKLRPPGDGNLMEIASLCWNFIWNLNVPPKLKLFLWKVCSDSFPSKLQAMSVHEMPLNFSGTPRHVFFTTGGFLERFRYFSSKVML